MFPILSAESSVAGKISLLEQQSLDGVELRFPEHLEFLAGFDFFRILGMPRPFVPDRLPHDGIGAVLVPLLSGMYALGEPLCCLLDVTPEQVSLYLGGRRSETGSGRALLRGLLEGQWGDGFLADDTGANARLRELSRSSCCGCVSGIPPAMHTSARGDGILPVDGWLKGMSREQWSWLVCGFCFPQQQVSAGRTALIAELAALRTDAIRDDILYRERRLAELYQSQLESSLKRCDQGRSHGVWQAGGWLFARDEQTLRRGLALAGASLSAGPARVQPLKTHLCRRDAAAVPSFSNLLTSPELASLLPFPTREVPGFRVSRMAEFDTDVAAAGGGAVINLGTVVRNNGVSGNRYSIPTADLTRHGLITGVTGSGKTTTCFGLLRQLRQQQIPFLVIESAKAEYRSLLADPQFDDLLVFTLGDETPGSSAPFRMNPFEAPEGTLVQSHLDYLKSLFRASFVMYAPMPYVLEEALHEIYRDKGWNLSTNDNPRGRDPLAFPTLSDLHDKIGEVVARTGYDERISKDILAGLRTRINNLRLGAKGQMLDTRQSIPLAELLNRPVILELHRLGNDDEKAFLIGLLLTRIYEHYEAHAAHTPATGNLRHLTLIEEAHRLLKHVPEESSEADGNVRGKAVESFCAMLSEIRAYGEGVLVAEQIPTKLARDLLKNTNIKVMHRMVARDDREMLGDTMNLTDEQKRHATTLRRGEAIVYAEGADAPYLVAMSAGPGDGRSPHGPVTGVVIHERMQQWFYGCHPALLRPMSACGLCTVTAARCASVRQGVAEAAVGEGMALLAGCLQLLAAFGGDGALLAAGLDRLVPVPLRGDAATLTIARHCLLSQAVLRSVERQGALYHYPFARMQELLMQLSRIVRRVAEGEEIVPDDALWNLLHSLRVTPAVPHAGCCHCRQRCLYRFEAGLLLNDGRLSAEFDYAVTQIEDDDEMWRELAALAIRGAGMLAPGGDEALLRGVSLCYLAQQCARNDYAPRVQEKVVRNVLAAMGTE